MKLGTVSLYGMTCLSCGEGFYNGYAALSKLTLPCNICGHQALSSMSIEEFRKQVAKRDQARFGE